MLSHVPLFFLVILGITSVAISCPCQTFLHTQDVFCHPDTDFVIKAKVKKVTTLSSEIKYKIKTKAVFKTTSDYNALSNQAKKFLWTYIASNQCPITLVKKKTYVVTGKVVNGKLRISSCGWIKQWNNLNAVEKQNLNVNYAPNCACSFAQVGGVRPPFPFPQTACVMISTQVSCGRLTWCKCTDQTCMSCTFQHSQDYQNCKDQFLPPP